MRRDRNRESSGQERTYGIWPQIQYTIKEVFRLCRYGKLQNRNFVVLRDKKLVYLSNPKVACSSILQTLTKDIMNDNSSIHQYPFEKVHKVPKDMKDYHSFTFVRNPFERLVSCYKNKYQGDLEAGKEQMSFDYYLLGIFRNDQGFERFARIVVRMPDCLSNRHFRSQYRLTHDYRGRKLVKEIGHMESMEEEFSAIRDRFDLGSLPHYNRTREYSWRDYYTLETAQLVYKRYRQDIKTFGYQDEYQQLIQHISDSTI